MLKALLLDMDETLCDTSHANNQAKSLMVTHLEQRYKNKIDGVVFVDAYVKGIYRDWSEKQLERYMPIIKNRGENQFRNQLIFDLFQDQGVTLDNLETAEKLQKKFDEDRLAHFAFFPGIESFLLEAKKAFTLVVITNGPEHSQLPKLAAVNLEDYVHYIIVGGQEPEQKPARSIFEKALQLADCEAHEAIHVGDSLAADIVGANNSGITSLWIQHQQPLDAELGINPDHTVMHPTEIPAFITRFNNA